MYTENVIDVILKASGYKQIESFECLKVYFRKLTIEDIRLTRSCIVYSDFINMVAPEDKIIMSVFIYRYLKPYFDNNIRSF